MRRVLLVRHARPTQLPGARPPDWPLAADGRDAVAVLRPALGLANVVQLVASDEPKAVATAELLGAGRPVVTTGAFAEVTKPWFDDPSAHEAATRRYLAGEPTAGWEPLSAAVARFGRGLEAVGNVERVIVVTHGTVMTAWLGSVLGMTDPEEFWAQLEMPDAYEVDLAARTCRRIRADEGLNAQP